MPSSWGTLSPRSPSTCESFTPSRSFFASDTYVTFNRRRLQSPHAHLYCEYIWTIYVLSAHLYCFLDESGCFPCSRDDPSNILVGGFLFFLPCGQKNSLVAHRLSHVSFGLVLLVSISDIQSRSIVDRHAHTLLRAVRLGLILAPARL